MEEDIQRFETILQNDWFLKIVTILVIVVATAIVSHLITKFLRKVLMNEAGVLPSSSIFVNITRAAIWIIGLCIILTTCFNVDVSAVVTALGVGGIALSLGFQDTISNLIGGLQVSLMKIVQPGDNIEVGQESGIVKDVTWRHTSILNSVGEVVIIPNSTINKTALVKLSPINQISIPFIVRSSGRDLDEIAHEIERTCIRVVEPISALSKEPKVIFTGVTDFGFKGKLNFHIQSTERAYEASDAVLRAIAPLTRPDEEQHE